MHNIGFAASDYWLLLAGGGLVLMLVAATLSYMAIERPVLRLARNFH